MRLPEYDHLDAIGLAERVARRELQPIELLEAALERADARNPKLNAVVARYDDEARTRARGPLPGGPLSGVPFLLKDLLAAWKGHPLTGSSRLLAGYVPPFDSEVVRRFEAAGLVLFGQTNTPELGILGTTESRFRGPARNPWSLEHSTGGSSGGSAAAVAARIVPAAHGNDEGGSLRIPPAWCGVVGLISARDLAHARADIQRAARGVAAFFEDHALLVTSTTARPPHRLGALALRGRERLGIRLFPHLASRRTVDLFLDEGARRSFEATGNTMLFNETGQPAMSLPLHWTRDGLPVGVQLAGRFGEEATVLRVAAQLEAARPWAERLPPGVT